MAWCPKCEVEYIDGTKECAICNESLVDKFDYKSSDKYVEDKETLLKTVSGEFEANIIESKLNQFGIPVMKKFDNRGYLKGLSFIAYHIYVPSKLLDLAKEIIKEEPKK
jgi:hypothetical protein